MLLHSQSQALIMFLLVAASTVTSSGEIRYYLYIFKLTGLTFCFHQCPLLQRGLVVIIIRYWALIFLICDVPKQTRLEIELTSC